jgi:hypothetical protein
MDQQNEKTQIPPEHHPLHHRRQVTCHKFGHLLDTLLALSKQHVQRSSFFQSSLALYMLTYFGLQKFRLCPNGA